MKKHLSLAHYVRVFGFTIVSLFTVLVLLLPGRAVAQCNTPLFYDSFETGTFSPTWVNQAATNIFTVNTGNTAIGTFKLEGTGNSSHLAGLMATVTPMNPNYICWYIYPTGTSATNYVVIGDNAMTTANCIVFCYWNPTNTTGPAISFASTPAYAHLTSANQWYKIELKNVNYVSHTFDIWINNVQVQTAFNFRSATQNSVGRAHIYNFNAGNTAVWDDMYMGLNNISFNATTSGVTCAGGSNGTATVATTSTASPISYTWSGSANTSSVGSNLTAGTYTVKMLDANTCTANVIFNITQPTSVTTSGSTSSVSCFGGNNGTATVTASGGSGPYTYHWPGSVTGASVGNLSQGVYTYTVLDTYSCSATQTVSVIEPSTPVSAIASSTDITCFGGSNGKASASPQGGTGGYTYSWVPSGGTGVNANNLALGNYTVYVTDANSCTTTAFVIINQPTQVTGTSSQTNITCVANGQGQMSAAGGNGPYTYSWSPWGGNTALISNLPPGTHTCLIKDANNCTAVKTITITQNLTTPTLVAQTSNASICKGETATVTITGNADSYLWNTGSTATLSPITPTGVGMYTITGQFNANGCTTSIIFTQMVLACTGLNENGAEKLTTAYPNPFNGELHLQLSVEAKATVYNAIGEKVFEQSLNEGHNTVNMNSCASGIYFINIDNGDRNEIIRVVKE